MTSLAFTSLLVLPITFSTRYCSPPGQVLPPRALFVVDDDFFLGRLGVSCEWQHRKRKHGDREFCGIHS